MFSGEEVFESVDARDVRIASVLSMLLKKAVEVRKG